jgi:O-antigen/teichoic acid export membrane protein
MKVGPAVVQTFSSQGLQSVASFAAAVVIARGLGPAGQGRYAVFAAAVGLGVVLASFGQFERNVLTSAGSGGPGRVLLSRSAAHAVAIAALLAGSLPLWGPLSAGHLDQSVRALFPAIIGLEVWALLLRGVNLGQHHVTAYNLTTLVQRFMFLAAVAILSLTVGVRLDRVVMVWGVAAAISITIGVVWAWRHSAAGAHDRRVIVAGWGESLMRGIRPLLVISLSLLLIRFDVWTLGTRLGAAAVGQLSVASTLAEWLWYVPTIVGSVLFAAVAADQQQYRIDAVARAGRFATAFAMPAAAFLVVAGRPIVTRLYGPDYDLAGRALVLLAPGASAIAVHLVIDTYFAGRGFPAFSLVAVLGALALKGIANTIVVPRYGVLGAAAATSIAYVALLASKLVALTIQTGVPPARFLLITSADLGSTFARVRNWRGRPR